MNKEASERFRNAPDFDSNKTDWTNLPTWDGDYNNMPPDLNIQKVNRNKPINSDGSSKCCGGNKRPMKPPVRNNNLKEHLAYEKKMKKDKKISE